MFCGPEWTPIVAQNGPPLAPSHCSVCWCVEPRPSGCNARSKNVRVVRARRASVCFECGIGGRVLSLCWWACGSSLWFLFSVLLPAQRTGGSGAPGRRLCRSLVLFVLCSGSASSTVAAVFPQRLLVLCVRPAATVSCGPSHASHTPRLVILF